MTRTMLEFLRPDLVDFEAYQAHPGGELPAGVEIDRLDTNECPYQLPESLKEKLCLTYQRAIETNRYPGGDHGEIKRAIAQYVNESCSAIANGTAAGILPEQISVGNGSDELIRSILIATCLGGRGRVLVAQPTFGMYGILAQTLGIPVERVGRSPKTFEIDLDAARKAIAQAQKTDSPVRVVWVVHPNSPTANALTTAELNWLRGLPPNILVVIDEAYFEFSRRTVAGELQARPNWVMLRTFSKAFRLAAHRVGYAIANPELAAVLEKVRLPYNLPSFTQAAALAALAHRRDLLSVIPEILTERDRLLQKLRALPGLELWDSQANFLYARLKGVANTEEAMAALVDRLKQQGTLIRHTGGGLRITVGSPAENTRTVDRMRVALALATAAQG
ncbi:MAG TPA: histidinol-phosphate transaminase [Coleofasciculaceae cyanobacterium]